MKVILRLKTNTLISEVSIEANTSITLGRSSRNDYKVPDELMSTTHCKISYHPPKLEITDMNSKNGTYINGIRIEQSEIFMGDEIKAGGTKITILSDKMDPNCVNALTFPGATRDRAHHGLKLDFTGARILNQTQGPQNRSERKAGSSSSSSSSSNKELEMRKKAQSNIRLSKHEIKFRNKRLSTLASTYDVILMVMAIAVPLIATNLLILLSPMLFKHHRLAAMALSEIVCVSLFYFINFKSMKFTLGEKISGIQAVYEKQEIHRD